MPFLADLDARDWTTAGAIAVAAAGVLAAWFKGKREQRTDEVAVLQTHIRELREEHKQAAELARTENRACLDRVKTLQDQYSTCLLMQAKTTTEQDFLKQQLAEQKEEIEGLKRLVRAGGETEGGPHGERLGG